MHQETFIFCLEAVQDVDNVYETETVKGLEQLATQGIDSIYQTCDSIETLEESLATLLYDDHQFTNYEIIYLVMTGEENNICLNNYYYSLEEIAEIFEGKMRGKIIHFANSKPLDLTSEESQYFLDITGAKAISGYGNYTSKVSSGVLDKLFFRICQDRDDIVEIVELLHEYHYGACKLLDFRLYY